MKPRLAFIAGAAAIAFLGALLIPVPHAPAQTPLGGAILTASLGSTGAPNPPTFSCPNDGVTGTTLNLMVKLSAANTCIVTATADASPGNGFTPLLGVCVSGCGTGGNAQIAPSGPVISCVFDNGTTFGHAAALSSSVAGDCTDSGGVRAGSTNGAINSFFVGVVLDTGAAGTHNVLLRNVPNPLGFAVMVNNTTLLNTSAFNGQFLFETAAGGSPFLQIGGTSATPCMTNSGNLLKVIVSTTNCTAGGDGNVGVGHLASDNAAPPTIASGFGTSPAIVSGGDLAVIVNVGTGGAATSGVLNYGVSFTTAPACIAQDITTNVATRCSASTTQATITAAAAWTASDKVAVITFGQNGL